MKLELTINHLTGSNNYFTLYSSISDRLFIYNKKSLTKNNRIYALDCNTGTIALEHEADYISGCQIDLEQNIIFVSSRNSNKIDVLSAEPGTNPIAEEIYLNTSQAECREIYTDNNGHLYCLAYQDYSNTYLETWDTETLQFVEKFKLNSIPNSGLGTIIAPFTEFLYNSDDDELYISLRDLGINQGGASGAIIFKGPTHTSAIQVLYPSSLEYDPNNDELYFIAKGRTSFMKCSGTGTNLTEIEYSYDNFYFVDIEYSPFSRMIYLTIDNRASYLDDEIKIYDCDNHLYEKGIITGTMPSSIKYNSRNNYVYFMLPFNQHADYSMECLRLDEENFIMDKIYLNQKDWERILLPYVTGNLSLSTNSSNNIYYTSGHSNINIIDEDNGCIFNEYSNYTFINGQNITWSSDKYIDKIITINDGASLTINNNASVYFKTNAKIIIKPGGKLIVDSATLTKACTGYWAGIEVWGSGFPFVTQFPDVNGNYNHGFLELKNLATIEYAQCGVLAAQRNFPAELETFYSNGGIIFAEDAIFNNNIVAIEIYPYTNIHPFTHDEFPYFANFNDCRFILDENHQYKINNYHHHVMLKGVDGITLNNCQFEIQNSVDEVNSVPDNFVYLEDCDDIRIKSCDFWNEMYYSDFPAKERGTGVYSVNTSLNIEGHCIIQGPNGECDTWDNSTFEGLAYGIVASNDRMLIPVRIDHTVFVDNARAVLLSGIQPSEITSNSFTLSEGFTSELDTLIGLYLFNCDGYHVENNVFIGDQNLFTSDLLYGCVVNSLDGGSNEIYNNSFDYFSVGVHSIGDNRSNGGLCVKCNDFTDNIHDVYIYAEDNSEGIAPEQGVPDDVLQDNTLPAGNTFSALGQPHTFDIHNELGGGIIYYFHEFYPFGTRIEPILNVGDVEINPNENTTYSKSGACPSKLNGGGVIPPESAMALNEQKADSIQTELYALIDGGDTEELNTDVVMSFPDEALEVRQQLLDESPYLSDSVMKSAIYKEDVLPNAMIRDVLVANPQSAKSDEVLDALDYRWDPMPDYMMGEIMAGEDTIGSKEIMEGQIRGYKNLRELAFNELVGIYLKDTINSWAEDSLIVLLQNETSLRSKYMLAFHWLEKEDTAQMYSVLNTIPTTFTLSPSQQQTCQNYLTYSSILMALQHDTVHNHYPDSTQLVSLYSLADTCYNLPSVYARNLLIHLGLISYNEPVYFPMALNSSIAEIAPFKDINFPKQSSISLFPNPAGNYFIIEYRIEKAYEKAIVSIHDINGKLVNMIPLKGKMNQTIIPTGEMNNGIYIVSLHVDNELEDSSKLTLLK